MMTWRALMIAGGLLAVLVAGSAAAGVHYDQRHEHTLAAGVKVAGVDVGGLTVGQARRRLERQLAAPLRQPVKVTVDRRTFTLPAARAGLRLDLHRPLAEALRRSRQGSMLARVRRMLFGQTVEVDVPVHPRHSPDAVRRFAASVKRKVDVAARDAQLRYSTVKLTAVPSRHGRALREKELRQRISRDLRSLRPTRHVRGRMQQRRPQVTTQQLPDRYQTVITVDRSANRLRLFKRLKLVKTYPISVGAQGYETPTGLYSIVNKQIDPAWHVPNSAWAGSLAGQVIPGGAPNNPLKARWMGIVGSVGIHGTAEENRIGRAASHGCIRMKVSDVKQLYDRVPVGTPVYIL